MLFGLRIWNDIRHVQSPGRRGACCLAFWHSMLCMDQLSLSLFRSYVLFTARHLTALHGKSLSGQPLWNHGTAWYHLALIHYNLRHTRGESFDFSLSAITFSRLLQYLPMNQRPLKGNDGAVKKIKTKICWSVKNVWMCLCRLIAEDKMIDQKRKKQRLNLKSIPSIQ